MDVTFDATKRELTTDQGTLRYHEAGDPSAPPLILLHGSGPGVTGWRNYRGNLGHFAQTHAHPELQGRKLVEILRQEHAADLGRSMPALGQQMSDADIVALVKFLRARFSTRGAWKL